MFIELYFFFQKILKKEVSHTMAATASSKSATRSATGTTSSSATVITSFSLNPLTTTFTPAANCAGYYSSNVYMAGPMTSCLPSGANLASTEYFSPGIICPSGYVSACHDTTGVHSITTVTCCPAQSGITLSCANPDPSGAFTTLFCTWVPPSQTAIPITLSDKGQTSTSKVTFTSPEGLNAYGVRMVYQSTDLITSSSTPASKSGTGTATKSSNTSTTSATSGPSSSGLSTSAKIAIAVVIPVVVLAILGALFIWWRRRKQRYDPVRASGDPTKDEPSTTMELSGENEMKRGELPADPGQTTNHVIPVELPTDNYRE